VSEIIGLAAVIDVGIFSYQLSPWWRLESGGCRDGALAANFDFRGGPLVCADPWSGSATGSRPGRRGCPATAPPLPGWS
jgi:hypothetical protein